MTDPAFDALYRERAHLLALLATHYPSHIQPDPVQTAWPVLYINLPTGQCCWHIDEKDMDLFGDVRTDIVQTWDGHTTEEKYNRVDALTQMRSQAV